MEKLFIIGGTGSLGHSLVERLFKTYNIIILSRDENKQWKMKKTYPFLTFVLCDMRDQQQFEKVLLQHKPNKIIIAGALKHIDICENNIDECIKTNIFGVQNILDIVQTNYLRKSLDCLTTVAFISTDKAASPVNVYGMCKSICERLMAERSQIIKDIKFVCVRYGNVLNSRGSLIPLFHDIGNNPNIPQFNITNEKMTRFFLQLNEGIDLIVKAMDEGESGDTYIPRIQSYRILDIANEFSKYYGKPIVVSGVRPGEKIHECLVNESEKYRTIRKGNVYVIKHCYTNINSDVDFETEYTSQTNLCTDISIIRRMIEDTHPK